MRKVLIAALVVLIALAVGLDLLVRRALSPEFIRAQVQQQLSARLGQPVTIGDVSVSVLPSPSIDLHVVYIGNPWEARLGRVRVSTGLRALLSRRVEDAEVLVEDAQVRWPLSISSKGPAVGGAADGSPGVTIASIRRITFRNVTLLTALPPIVIDLDASLNGDRLDISRLTTQSGQTRIEGEGAITSVARLEGQFRAKGALSFAGYTARDLAATMSVSPRGLSLSPLAFGMFDGTFNGRLDVDLVGAAPQVRLQGSVAHVDVADVMKDTASKGGITGRLAGSLSLAGSGADGAALLHSGHGTFTAKVTDGTLPYIDIVRPVVLAFGKPSGATPGGSGSSFSTLGGSFGIARGTLTTDNLDLEARDFSGRGRTSLQIESGAVDAHLDVLLSQELTAQSGTDLRRYAAENGRVVLPATVGGTLTHPSVFVDPAAAARRALTNEVQRKAKSLLNGLFKKKGGGGD
jgi:uncharacterized protein involved in outer membrane biogenesis